MKLNGWHRIGLILSVIWVFGSILYARNDQMAFATRSNVINLNLCYEMAKAAQGECLKTAEQKYNALLKTEWYNLLLLAVFPVIYAWTIVFFVVWVAQKVVAAYRAIK